MSGNRRTAYTLLLMGAACLSAGCSGAKTEGSADSAPQQTCTIGPGPSLEAVVALGADITRFDGATIRACRNAAGCAEATFALPADAIPLQAGSGPAFPAQEDDFVTATFWNEGSDGYVFDLTYLAEVPPPGDGDTYSVMVTLADASTAVNLSGPATYTHIPNCAGGYSYFRMGIPCPDKTAAPECVSDWDPIECRCRTH